MEDKRHKCSVSFLINPQEVTGPSEIKSIKENPLFSRQPQNTGPQLEKSNVAFDKLPHISDRSSWSEEEEAAIILMRMRLDDSSSYAKETSEGLVQSRPRCKRRKKKKAFSRAKR
ncbi:unnamed protein product [Blumeria hordei]|uniref:Uncharacterized protein n=1 Tax=Blumeria hordei TaxID=2867405 RepID=A0A383UZ38_BLUHO|nr:unnamed protein product [Blumeria hordei]